MDTPSHIKFLRLPAVKDRRGQSHGSVYRGIKAGLLPPPVRLGKNTSAWPEHELDAIARAEIAGASEDKIRALVADLVAARKLAA